MLPDNDDEKDDNQLFRKRMCDVKRIRAEKHDLRKSIQKPKPVVGRHSDFTEQENEPLPYLPSEKGERVLAEEEIRFSRSGISEKLMRSLKHGNIPVRGHLDLHGMTTAQAEQALLQFFNRHQRSEQTCVLVIHGKGHRGGEPKLKNTVNHWLRHMGQVLAFCSAKPTHGGTGAVYVLLKRV